MLLSQSLTTLALNDKNYFFYANKEIHCGIVEEIEFGQFVTTCCEIDLFFFNAFFFHHLYPLTSICNFLLKE